MGPVSSPVSSPLRPMWTKQLRLSATHGTWAWLVGQVAEGKWPRSPHCHRSETPLSFGFTSILSDIPEYSNCWENGKKQQQQKYINILGIYSAFCLLLATTPPPPLPGATVLEKPFPQGIHDTGSSLYPSPQTHAILSVDFVLHGDVIGVKAGVVCIYRILSVTPFAKPSSWPFLFNTTLKTVYTFYSYFIHEEMEVQRGKDHPMTAKDP